MKEPKNSKKTSPDTGFAMPGVDVQQLEMLLDFMAAHGLEEFEYEHSGLHIRLRKAPVGASPAPSVQMAPRTSAPCEPAAPAAPAPAAAPRAEEELHLVKSPIVGTFYSAPNPDAGPFVKPGDSVQAGQVICIVEAMKLMNEIEADASGEVVRVLVENGQPVEYGQPLFALRPGKKK
jgi:acetyl-CoA carboxylase biotin carboxyl carrier protein